MKTRGATSGQQVVIDRVVDGLVGVLRDVDSDVPERLRPVVWSTMRSVIDGAEANFFASAIGDGDSERNVANRLRNAGASKKEANKRAKRARTVNSNPDLGSLLESGDASGEQIDTIAAADDKSDGAASADPELVDEILDADPDMGSSVAKRWLRERDDDEMAGRRRDRQRRERCVYRTAYDDVPAIVVKGDEFTIEQIWAQITATADTAWRNAGGRDVPAGEQVPLEHRLFDAVHQLITGTGDTTHSSRPTVVLTATVDDQRISSLQLAGGEKLPTSLLAELAGNVDLLGAVFGTSGRLLWLGRNRRHATPAQIIGLIARDQSCVLCGASHNQCDAHHLIPWNAPQHGETNIDNLALVCHSCHRWLHATNRTLHTDTSGVWRHRPATPQETPPPPRPNPPPKPRRARDEGTLHTDLK